jgi:hypothetical protein
MAESAMFISAFMISISSLCSAMDVGVASGDIFVISSCNATNPNRNSITFTHPFVRQQLRRCQAVGGGGTEKQSNKLGHISVKNKKKTKKNNRKQQKNEKKNNNKKNKNRTRKEKEKNKKRTRRRRIR